MEKIIFEEEEKHVACNKWHGRISYRKINMQQAISSKTIYSIVLHPDFSLLHELGPL